MYIVNIGWITIHICPFPRPFRISLPTLGFLDKFVLSMKRIARPKHSAH